jgi:uncharacterized protein GlcG (DUF336 family)
LAAASVILVATATACGDSSPNVTAALQPSTDERLPTHDQLEAALKTARGTNNGGLNFDMWATVVDRTGIVVAVAFTGAKEGDQWLGSRVISAQKANTANAFSLPQLALSTANLYAPAQPGGTLFGLQESNPVDPAVAYGGKAEDYGTERDFMVGKRIGGINVFGGGVALYASDGTLLGGLGVSGDLSCADHNIVWKTRFNLGLDHVPAGVTAEPGFDNIIYDIDPHGSSPSGFGHPTCTPGTTAVSESLPTEFPIGHE